MLNDILLEPDRAQLRVLHRRRVRADLRSKFGTGRRRNRYLLGQRGFQQLRTNDRKLIALIRLVADLAGVGVVVDAKREPPVPRLGAKVLHIAMRDGGGVGFAVAALAMRFFL